VTGDSDGPGSRQKRPTGRLARLVALLIAPIIAVFLNKLSNDVSYRNLAIIAAAVAILLGAAQLRQYLGSRLVVASSRIALILASVCAVLAVIVSSPWSNYAVFGAAMFTVTATVIPLDRYDVVRILGGIATIGIGVSLISDAIGFLQGFSDPMMLIAMLLLAGTSIGNTLSVAPVAAIGVAISLIGAGIALLFRRDTLLGVAGVGLGISLIGGGIAAQPIYGKMSSFPAWLIASGVVAAVGAGIAFPLARSMLIGAANIGIGLAFVGVGTIPVALEVKFAHVSSSLGLGIWLIVTGVVAIGAGVLLLLTRGRLVSMAGVGLGLSLISGGVAALTWGNTPQDVWLIVAGAVAIGAGVLLLLMPGVLLLLTRGRLVSIAETGLGLSLISGGVVVLITQNTELILFEALFEAKLVGTIATVIAIGAWVAIGAGVAAIAAGVTLPLARGTILAIAGVCLGISLIGTGVEGEIAGLLLFGAWLIAAGVSLIGLAIARLQDRWHVLGGIAAIGFGISFAVPAVEFFSGGEPLGAVAAVGAGVALATVGVRAIFHPSQAGLRRWWSRTFELWTRRPGEPRTDRVDETTPDGQ
jgi:hypothetical protein